MRLTSSREGPYPHSQIREAHSYQERARVAIVCYARLRDSISARPSNFVIRNRLTSLKATANDAIEVPPEWAPQKAVWTA
jgi:hypothetical protein